MWDDLAKLGLQVRPFDGPVPADGGQWSKFGSPLRKTLMLLRRELEMLNAKHVVVELDVSDRDIRLDGYPRANAKLASPAVRVTFDSKHGPLRYETSEYRDWQDNLRAIALSMESLRAVDRYGVSKRGEQYKGWRAIPKSTDAADSIATPSQARTLIDGYGGLNAAIKATHPDTGGDPDQFRKVMRAKELLSA